MFSIYSTRFIHINSVCLLLCITYSDGGYSDGGDSDGGYSDGGDSGYSITQRRR